MKKIISVILAVLVLALSVGCGAKKPSNEAEAYLETNLGALKKGTNEALMELVEDDEAEEVEALMDAFDFSLMLKNFDYKILSCEMQDDSTAVASLTISNTDFAQVMEKYITELQTYVTEHMDELLEMDDEESEKLAMDILADVLEKGNFDVVSTELELELEKVDGEWNIVNSEDLPAALVPGIEDLF